jgi:PAS domain S-box-containing protein
MKNILVIDDNAPFRSTVLTALKRQGYEVSEAGDGVTGLAAAFAQKPSVILSDLKTGGREGFDLLKGLRAHPETSTIPVIFMTGEPPKTDGRTGMDQGAEVYLKKPFTMEQLLEMVQVRLRRQDGIAPAVEAQGHAEPGGAVEKPRLETEFANPTAGLASASGASKEENGGDKRVGESPRLSREEFKDLFDNAHVGFHEIDAEGRLVRINDTELKMLGYSGEELLGQFVWKISAEEEASRRSVLAKLNGQTPPRGFGRMFRRKDGSTFPVLISDRMLKRKDGSISGIRSAVQDNTERKRTKDELVQKRDLLQALMNNLPDYIYFKDADSRFISINQALARHLGLKHPDEAVGKSDADFFPAHLARQKLADEQCLLANGTPILGLEEKSDTASGAKWVSSTKVPIRGSDGKIIGLVGISRDITERKQSVLERQRMEEQLRLAQKPESTAQPAAGSAPEFNTSSSPPKKNCSTLP